MKEWVNQWMNQWVNELKHDWLNQWIWTDNQKHHYRHICIYVCYALLHLRLRKNRRQEHNRVQVENAHAEKYSSLDPFSRSCKRTLHTSNIRIWNVPQWNILGAKYPTLCQVAVTRHPQASSLKAKGSQNPSALASDPLRQKTSLHCPHSFVLDIGWSG